MRLASPVPARTRDGNSERYWEVDAVRGIAIVMMVLYHLVYDFYYFGLSDMVFTHAFWFYFQRTTASTFIALVGVSLALRYQSYRVRAGQIPFLPLLRRGITILGWGMVITAITWFALGPRLAVRFGILHFIGVATVAAYPFLQWRWPNLVLGVLFLMVGQTLQTLSFDRPWLMWLGFEPAGHVAVDYFPFIKWFGVVLLGIFLGHTLYGPQGRQFVLPGGTGWLPLTTLAWCGRYSLPIYLLHQPVLLGILFLLLGTQP
jgi:uncharacterized membrane protein